MANRNVTNRSYGAAGKAKFLKVGSSKEETGMAQRSGTANRNFQTIIRVKDKSIAPTSAYDNIRFTR